MTSQSINKGHVENAGGGTCAASKIPALGSEDRCSIQLSHGCMWLKSPT